MSTPAAKRRRADTANAVLRKPFHSPVIRKPNDPSSDPDGRSTQGPSKTPDVKNQVADDDVYSPSSPSVLARPPQAQAQAQALRQARPFGALRQNQTPKKASSNSPLKFKTPLQSSAVKRKRASLETPENKGSIVADDDKPGASLLALVSAHRHTAQDAALKDLDRRLETMRQARRIEDASGGNGRREEPIDQELRELVGKWKGACRTAAEELFDSVKDRVENAGGPKAWKEMRQRQLDFYQGFDQDSPSKRKPAAGGMEEELEGDGEDETIKYRLADDGEKDDGKEEESEPEFNMAQMLRSLNIDLSLLGYDEVEEKWID